MASIAARCGGAARPARRPTRPSAGARQRRLDSQTAPVGDQAGASSRERLTLSNSPLRSPNRRRRVSTRHPHHRRRNHRRPNRACWASPDGVRWSAPWAGRNAGGRSPGPARRRPGRRRRAGRPRGPAAQRWATPGWTGWSPVSGAIVRPPPPGTTDRIDVATRPGGEPDRSGRSRCGGVGCAGPSRGNRHGCDRDRPEPIRASRERPPKRRPHRDGGRGRHAGPPADRRSTPR